MSAKIPGWSLIPALFLGLCLVGVAPAAEARRQAKLIERRGAAKDHPALLSLPESLYLKCLILEVV